MDKNPRLKIYGLIGYPVKHSLSPAMHNAAFKALNINAEYRLFEVEPEKLEDFLLRNIEVRDTKGESFFSQDVIGFNITIPHKVRAKEILERGFLINKDESVELEDSHYVKISGAVNTVRRIDNKLEYFNTDAVGFLKSLEKDLKFDTRNKNALILGCGGAGRAVVAALSWKQNRIKKIFIHDTDKEAMESARNYFSSLQYIIDKIKFISAKEISEIIKDCNLLINASPVGMKEGDDSIIGRDLLHKNLSIYDVIYNRETQLIKDAKFSGLNAVNGLGMLLYQGAEAFELWTGESAPVEVMRSALLEAINK